MRLGQVLLWLSALMVAITVVCIFVMFHFTEEELSLPRLVMDILVIVFYVSGIGWLPTLVVGFIVFLWQRRDRKPQ